VSYILLATRTEVILEDIHVFVDNRPIIKFINISLYQPSDFSVSDVKVLIESLCIRASNIFDLFIFSTLFQFFLYFVNMYKGRYFFINGLSIDEVSLSYNVNKNILISVWN